MDHADRRRTRLAQLLELAQNYKSCTRKELAKSLGRDPTKLIPGSGVPKLDFVVDLAGVLDWSVGQVVGHLCPPEAELSEHEDVDDFEFLDTAAREAHRNGEYRLMIDRARQAYEAARTADERARACNREAGGWDGIGRYKNELKAIQRGLQLSPVSADYRRMLQSNLANTYYSLWSLVESRALAAELVTWYSANPPASLRDRKTLAFAHYVAGHTYRRLVMVEPDSREHFALMADEHLRQARDRYLTLADDSGDDSYGGIANTCVGGLIEMDVALERRTPENALDELMRGLDRIGTGDEEMPVGDLLESYGWWCIMGCNVALQFLKDEKELQQCMAVFTNKADEVAERLDNWSMRERVFTMEHSRWERAVGCTGFDIPRVVDEDDVRIITGTMARFPTFRDTGWQILRSAKVVRSN